MKFYITEFQQSIIKNIKVNLFTNAKKVREWEDVRTNFKGIHKYEYGVLVGRTWLHLNYDKKCNPCRYLTFCNLNLGEFRNEKN